MTRRQTKTEITIERRQRTTVRLSRRRQGWCAPCAAEVLWLAPDEAAALARTTSRNLFRLIEAERLHFFETDNGELFICRNALLSQIKPS